MPSGSPSGSIDHSLPAPRSGQSTPIDDSLLGLENSLSFRVSVVAKLLDRRLSRLVGDRFGLAVAEYRVLTQVTLYPRSTVRVISERTFVDKAQVSRAVSVLEGRGLVIRALPASDRRSPVFTASKTGRQLIRKIVPQCEAQERELLGYLTSSDVSSLLATMQLLIKAFGEPAGDAPQPATPAPRGASRTSAASAQRSTTAAAQRSTTAAAQRSSSGQRKQPRTTRPRTPNP